jgi:putative sigma-54 modulation protein
MTPHLFRIGKSIVRPPSAPTSLPRFLLNVRHWRRTTPYAGQHHEKAASGRAADSGRTRSAAPPPNKEGVPMTVRITGRKTPVTATMQGYIDRKIPKIMKYGERIHDIEFIVSKDRYTYGVEVTLKDGPISVTAKVKDPDFDRAVDQLVEKVERQMRKKWDLRRGKVKRRELSPKRKDANQALDFPLEGEEAGGTWPSRRRTPTSRDRRRSLPLLVEKLGVRVFPADAIDLPEATLEGAAEELFFKDENFLVFTNKENGRLSVMYRRKDGNFGLYEPGLH